MALKATARGCLWLALSSSLALAGAYPDDLPLSEYLRALAQITPAARDGAQAYLRAFQENCGRPMRTVQLRQAVAEGSGEPILMAMIRAAHDQDKDALRSLSARVPCGGKP